MYVLDLTIVMCKLLNFQIPGVNCVDFETNPKMFTVKASTLQFSTSTYLTMKATFIKA